MSELLRKIQNLPDDRKARIVDLFNRYSPETPGVTEFVSSLNIHARVIDANPSPVLVVRYAKYEAALERIIQLEDELHRVKAMLAAAQEAKPCP